MVLFWGIHELKPILEIIHITLKKRTEVDLATPTSVLLHCRWPLPWVPGDQPALAFH